MTVIDDRRPGEPAGQELSNFSLLEDRQTHALEPYLTTDGQVMGSADGWAFAMRMTGLDKLEFVNGPAAKITDNTSFVVSQYTYPPSYPPGPSSGTCAPVVDSILGGVGALERDGTLSLTLNWTHTCGGEASRSVTKYSMTWVPALSASEFPQL